MNDKYNLIREILVKYNQEEVLNVYEKLNDEAKKKMKDDILSLNFELLEKLYANRNVIEKKDGVVSPITYFDKEILSQKEKDMYTSIGEEVIRTNQYAICIMAGGQGTRLGHHGPKGTYLLKLEQPKTLFQILVDKVIDLNKKYNIQLKLYIMTSEENNDETIKYFEDNNYCGYDKEHIIFFKQGKLPLLDIDGKLIYDEDGNIKQAADGNGGIFESLYSNEIIDKLENDKVEWFFIGNIDNALLELYNPLMLGLAINSNMKIASESTEKVNPEERVGVFYKLNGKPGIIEYTEISDEMRYEKDENGNYLYYQSNLGVSIINIELLKKICKEKLPYHVAFKKVEYFNSNGEKVLAEKPNIYKFEMFIFDAFGAAEDMLVYKVKREDCFAPVKNAEGVDSPETAIELYNNYMKRRNVNG